VRLYVREAVCRGHSMIRFTCPNPQCCAKLQIVSDRAGKNVLCPRCRQKVAVPTLQDMPPRTGFALPGSARRPLVVASSVVVMFLVILCVGIWIGRRSASRVDERAVLQQQPTGLSQATDPPSSLPSLARQDHGQPIPPPAPEPSQPKARGRISGKDKGQPGLLSSTIIEAVARAGRGEGVPEAAAYDPDRPGPHPLVFLNATGRSHVWNNLLPDSWRPQSVAAVE